MLKLLGGLFPFNPLSPIAHYILLVLQCILPAAVKSGDELARMASQLLHCISLDELHMLHYKVFTNPFHGSLIDTELGAHR